MRSLMWAVLMSFLCATALAQEKAEPKKVAEAKEAEEFTPPPGYLPKKRGDKVVYCKKDVAIGTRFKAETCYDAVQLRALLLAREQANRDFDQRRALCSNPATCATP